MKDVFSSARWVWCQKAADRNAYVAFRQAFTADGNGECVIRVSADAQYALSLNGAFVAAGQYADDPKYKVYDEIDVSRLVRPGENLLELTGYCPVTESSVYRLGVPGVMFEVLEGGRVRAASGPDTLCAPDARYRSGEIEMVSQQLGYTFEYDARRRNETFTKADVVAGAEALFPRPVSRLLVGARKPGAVVSQGIYGDAPKGASMGGRMQYAMMAMREIREMADVAARPRLPDEAGVLFSARDGAGMYLLIDLFEEDAGWLDLEIELDEPAEILIGWGEHTDDLRLRTFVGARNFAARYMATAGRQRFMHPFKRAGLRYVQLFLAARRARLFYAGILPTHYAVSRKPRFHTADRLHRRIYEVSKRTLLQCMHEHYEDCPWREQALYTMDSRNQMLCGYYAFGEYDMPKASLRLLALSIREDGLLELCAPARVPITIPSFTAVFLVQLQEYLLFSGDADFAREMLPVAEQIAEAFLARVAGNGLIPAYRDKRYWNFYEWQPYLEGYQAHEMDAEHERFDAPLNLFVALGLARLADMLKMLGEEARAARYAQAADALRARVDALFWDADLGGYATFRNARGIFHHAQLTQALAVCADACPPDRLDSVLRHLTQPGMTEVTTAYKIFQFDALLKRPEQYGRWVFDHVAEHWGSMLYQNATTFWETIEGAWDFENAGSLCHGWSAVPAYLYFAYALGIRPTKPGFAEYDISPVPCGLYELEGLIVARDGRTISV